MLKQRILNLRRRNDTKISFSQCGEDLIIRFLFDQLHISRPSYVDIGAHHPFYLSNTALFYLNGSRGINIEPDPQLFESFKKHRSKDINLNIGIGEQNGEADFYIISSPTLNTFSKQQAEGYKHEGNYDITKTMKTPIRQLTHIIDEYHDGIFPDFLNLDAEGIDELIIKAIDYAHNSPLVLCVETISFSTSGQGVKNVDLIKFVTDNGYMAYADTYINTIFVKKEAFRKRLNGNC